VRILFAMASAEYLRYYDSTIRLLADRGHDVLIAVNHDRGDRKPVTLDGLRGAAEQRVSVLGVIPAADPFWDRVGRGLRGTMDFVRYLDPRFADAHALRARIRRKVLPRALHGVDRIRSLGRGGTRAVLTVLAACERAIPTPPALDRFLAETAPNAVLVSPLVDAASPQVDLVKSAQRRGIPVAAGIASWDNLTNKGLLRVQPDLVLVWNDIQKDEATALHGMASERVAVTGAQPFDRWFGRTPSRPAEEFCRMLGFAAATPFALFTCSSGFISEGGREVAFVRRWIESLRRSADPTIASLPVVVRPHPYNTRAWADADLSDLPLAVVWPRGPYNPVSDEERDGFFDSLYYSAAVVGINTSAMIEAAIVGRPVLSIRAPDFAGTQEGTLHFQYLLPENGGFVRVAETFDEHAKQLADALASPEAARQQTQRFVDRFIRPRGRHVEATPVVADTLEALALRHVRHRGAGVALALRPAMWAIGLAAAAADTVTGDRWHRTRKSARMRWHRARKKMARVTGTATVGR
jgi:hypothetical protein